MSEFIVNQPSPEQVDKMLLSLKLQMLKSPTQDNLMKLLACLHDATVLVPRQPFEKGNPDLSKSGKPLFLQDEEEKTYFPMFSDESQIPDSKGAFVVYKDTVLHCIARSHTFVGLNGLILDPFTRSMVLPFHIADLIPTIERE